MATLSGLSIVIPAWNEEDRLPRTLDRYLPALESRGEPFEVIVVADGDGDRTVEVAERYANRGVRVLRFPEKLGKGGAIVAGLNEARYEYVGYLDADGPIPPTEIDRLVGALEHADCVIASRWVRGSVIERPEPTINTVLGRGWNFMVRALLFLSIKDTQCGAKFLRRSVVGPTLRAVALTNRAFDVDLLYHVSKNGHSLKEVPVTWRHDPATRMPIGRAVPVMLVSLLGIRVMNLPFRRRVPERWVHAFLEKWGDV